MDKRSKELRKLVLSAFKSDRRGHIGPTFSLIEILRVLFDSFLKFNPEKPMWKDRDRLILSKGHGCLALYAILADYGFFDKSELEKFCKYDSILGGHPEYGKVPGIEASTGALGHGLAIGVGIALAAKINKKAYRTVVITGDGELNEGSVWESAMSASMHKLSNLIVVVDKNNLQSYGLTRDVIDMGSLKSKWEAFGFEVFEIDGHDIQALEKILSNLPHTGSKPITIICNTIKGKGFDFAEGNANWHHKSYMDDELLNKMSKLIE